MAAAAARLTPLPGCQGVSTFKFFFAVPSVPPWMLRAVTTAVLTFTVPETLYVLRLVFWLGVECSVQCNTSAVAEAVGWLVGCVELAAAAARDATRQVDSLRESGPKPPLCQGILMNNRFYCN